MSCRTISICNVAIIHTLFGSFIPSIFIFLVYVVFLSLYHSIILAHPPPLYHPFPYSRSLSLNSLQSDVYNAQLQLPMRQNIERPTFLSSLVANHMKYPQMEAVVFNLLWNENIVSFAIYSTNICYSIVHTHLVLDTNNIFVVVRIDS